MENIVTLDDMFLMSVLTVLSGSLTIDQQPVDDQTVLIIDEKGDSIIYSCKTDSSGHFSWQYPDSLSGHKVHVLARFRTDEIISTEYSEVTLLDTASLSFNIKSSELEDVTLELAGNQGLPNQFYLRLFAESIMGVPQNMQRFLYMETNSVGGYYYQALFTGKTVKLKIRKGIYRLSADYIVISRSLTTQATSENFIATQGTYNGYALEGSETTGFRIDLTGPARIVLTMTRKLR